MAFPSQTPEYRRAQYAEKKAKLNAARRERYATDPDYRASVLAYNRGKATPEYELRRRNESLVNAAKIKIGKCLCCGYSKHVGALQWHHVDPSKKTREPSSLRHVSDHTAIHELRECILICSNCHWEVTHGVREIDPYTHFRCIQWLTLFALNRARTRGECS